MMLVRTAVWHDSKTSALNAEHLRRLERNEVSMLYWLCIVSMHERQYKCFEKITEHNGTTLFGYMMPVL